jgi:hypothetical protein
VKQLVKVVVPPIVEMWVSEDERDASNELCNSFSAALMSVGPALIVPEYVRPVCKEVSKILQRKAAC